MVKSTGKVTFRGSSRLSTSLKSESSLGKPVSSSTMIKKTVCPATPSTKMNRDQKAGFTIPALSIPPKTPPLDPVLERLKKRTVRRNAPEGEDLKQIKEIIRSIKGEVVTVQEYVGLVSPYTGDAGNILCTVMAEDLSHFRKMAKRVYETMTQDVSDVLANEQIQLTEYYTERAKIAKDNMERALKKIYGYDAKFDFQKYYKNPAEYLANLFPLPKAGFGIDPEEEELERRQMAYHRLQWLRSEGTRLSQENAQLQARLKELKAQQREEQMESKRREEIAEAHKSQLEETEAQLQDKLQDLNETVGQSIIDAEEEMRIKNDMDLKKSASQASEPKKYSSSVVRPRKSEPWNVRTAKVIEQQTLQQCMDSTLASESGVSVSSKTGTVKKLKKKAGNVIKRPEWQDLPLPTSPPQQCQRKVSPFHYSPPKSPPLPTQAATEKFRIESSKTVIEETPKRKVLPPPRRSLAPRDSWGGF